ncbi:MAG: Fe-S cluster assembly ATP-binding protein [Patescibacteria group bacterium]|nr:Fe-S cluster assembly ATP-binding protein [Patescibacteria group bacterium]
MKQAEFLKIKNLTVTLQEKAILKGVNLIIRKGETHALLGPNGSGKSTLAQVIMGLPPYRIKNGSLIFEGHNLTKLSPETRAKLGIQLIFQNPPPLNGISLSTLLPYFQNLHKDNFVSFQPFIFEKEIQPLLDRDLNKGFSGGEKKIAELYQIVQLQPRFLIIDEIDSGLDLEKLNKVIVFLKKQFLAPDKSLLIITHREEILRYLQPTTTHIMKDGQLVFSSPNWKKIWQQIQKYGYKAY